MPIINLTCIPFYISSKKSMPLCKGIKCPPYIQWFSTWWQTAVSPHTRLHMWVLLIHSHYSDVIMGTMASQITSLTIVHSIVYSGADQRKHQNSASLAFVRGIHRWPVNSPHKEPVTRKMFPFDDVIMPNLNGAAVQCLGWISNFIPQFTAHGISYPYWNWR